MNTNTVDRKALAQALAVELGTEPRYLGVPSCTYRVGGYTINRDGTIDGDLEAIRDFLIRHGIIQEDPKTPSTDTDMTEPTPLPLNGVDNIELSIPANDLTPQQLINLIHILYARQKLLAAMTRNNGIHMDEELIGLLKDEKPDTAERILELMQNEVRAGMVTGINITAEVFTLTLAGADHSDDLTTYVRLMSALLLRAKEAEFVSARLIEPVDGEMKYYVNAFLNQLGFGGADHKEDRRILMGHIKGYAAFKNNAQMNKHKASLKEKRHAARQETASSNLEAGEAE